MARLCAHWVGDGDETLLLNVATWGWDDLAESVELIEMMIRNVETPVTVFLQIGALRAGPVAAASAPLARLADLPIRRLVLAGNPEVTGQLAAVLEIMLPYDIILAYDTERIGVVQAA